MSLKKYIETLLCAKAASVTVKVHENPSPSGDVWFDNPANITELDEGIRQSKEGKTKSYTIDELRTILKV